MSTGSLRDLKDPAPIPRVKKKHGSEGDVVDGGESQWLQHEDQTDALPEILRFNLFDIFCITLSMFTYVFDLGMDLYVAYVYYSSSYIGYFILTLIFVILASVTMTAFSLRWYVMDIDNQTIPKPSCTKWIVRTVFLLLQLSPVLRYFDALCYGMKSRRAAAKNNRRSQLKYYTYMVNEDADSTLLRLFEGFMESAPQVTLHLYILIYHFNDSQGPFNVRDYKVQMLAIFSSLISLAWALAVYNRSLRYAQPDKKNISYKGTLLQFCWHLFSISARVFALGVFAATYPVLIIPACVAHWLAMLAWLIVQGNQACANQCEEALFNLVVAFIYVFTFFNVRDEPTRYKYLTFYLICFLENTVLLLTWFFSLNLSTPEILWFRISGLVGHYALFFLGILCMVLYYVYFHPSVGMGLKKEPIRDSQMSFPLPPEPKNKMLARKGSIDQTQLVGALNNPHSASSSRKNVSFSADGVATSCGNPKKIVSVTVGGNFDQSKSKVNSPGITNKPIPIRGNNETRL